MLPQMKANQKKTSVFTDFEGKKGKEDLALIERDMQLNNGDQDEE